MKKKLTTLMFLIIFLVSSSIQTNSNVVQIEADDSYAPWHFIAFGDSRNWDENITNEIRKSVFEDVMLSNPNLEFILHSGDMAYNGGEQDDWNRYYEDIDLLVQNDIQFYYAVGNHEMYTYRFPNGTYGPLDMDFSTYMANVEMPGNERFYSFDFNQIHFIIINTEEYWTHPDDYEYEITPEQYSWIIDDLESNNKSFTIAMFHRPSYSVRSESRNQDSRVIRAVLEPILIDYGVDLVFSGHDHYYYRTTRNGIVHITTGGAGAPLYTPIATEYAIEGDKYFAEHHYCNVSVIGDKLTITVMMYDENLEYTTVEDTIEFDLNGIITPTETPTETTPSETPTEASYLSGFLIFLFIITISIQRKRKDKKLFKM